MSGDGEVSVKFSSVNEANLFRAIVQVVQKVNDVKSSLDETTEAAKKLDPAIKRFADSVKSISADPLKQLVAENAKLDAAIAAGALTEEQAVGARSKAQERYRAELRRTREEAQAGGRASVGADGLPVLEQADASDPLTRYKQRLEELRAELKATTIDQRTFQAASKAAADDYAEEMKAVNAETKKANESLKKFATDLAKQDSTPLDRHRERMEKLNLALSRGAVQQAEYEAAARKSFGTMQRETDEAAAKLDRLNGKTKQVADNSKANFSEMATSAQMAWAAMSLYVMNALNQVQQSAKEAGAAMKAAAPSVGTIAQISSSPEQFSQLNNLAQQALAMGAAKDMADANQFIIAMQNAGAIDEFEKFATLRRFGVMERPEQMIAGAAGLQTSMGVDKTGSKVDIANMAFVAGGAAPDTAEQVIKGAGKAGVAANQQGATTAELLAVTAILSKAFGGSDVGGDRAKEFFEKLAISEPKLDDRGRVAKDSPLQQSLRGQSLEQILGNQELSKMSPAQLQRTFGSSQFAQAYGTLMQARDEVLALAKETQAAKDKDLFGQKVGMVASDSSAMAVIETRTAEGRLQLNKRAEAARSVMADKAQADIQSLPYRISQGPEKPRTEYSFFERMTGLNDVDQFRQRMGWDNRPKGGFDQQITSEIGRQGASLIRTVGGDEALIRISEGTNKSAEASAQAAEMMRQANENSKRANEILESINQQLKRNATVPRSNLSNPARREAAANAN
jgi:hypothetical protein